MTRLQLPHARDAHVGVTGAAGLVKQGEPCAEPGECPGGTAILLDTWGHLSAAGGLYSRDEEIRSTCQKTWIGGRGGA